MTQPSCLCTAAPPSMAVPMSNEERFRRDMQSVLTQVLSGYPWCLAAL